MMFSLLFVLACNPKLEPAPMDVVQQPTGDVPAAGQVVRVGQAAPDFSLTDTAGVVHKLSDYAGKTVVLEWFNPDCPFVKYAHGAEGPLASVPATYVEKGVVWLAINSGAEGKQGAGLDRNIAARTEYNMGYPVMMDPQGEVGRLYGAKTTPHMYVVDGSGNLVYAGAFDNAPLGKVEGEQRVNHVAAALDALAAGQPVPVSETKPYGCSVKY